ncbi:MAG: hypothetical protein J4F39_04340 [Candidatus Latescibacteria bacterium]|nr:hypothetical protein [Candidatus Latescibacterota bacterium]
MDRRDAERTYAFPGASPNGNMTWFSGCPGCVADGAQPVFTMGMGGVAAMEWLRRSYAERFGCIERRYVVPYQDARLRIPFCFQTSSTAAAVVAGSRRLRVRFAYRRVTRVGTHASWRGRRQLLPERGNLSWTSTMTRQRFGRRI